MTNPDLTRPRLRFAPSPTGYLHVGGARTALFNWLYARKYGGQFLLRIEDTDKARSNEESTKAIFDGLTWLGLDWDEEVVFQGANVERHRADALRLLESGAAYRCFCTAAELDERRRAAEAKGETFRYDRRCAALAADESERRVAAGEPFAVRFRIPEGTTEWDDAVHGHIAFPNKDLDDLIILRSDGSPIYNMAVVSDDIAMRITLVMRAEEHISNTPKQILLYSALGAQLPRFAHVPMILGTDGKKLSKRRGATAVGDYRTQGILPSAMVNFLALLGWSPGGDREVMSLGDMIALFGEEGLLRKASVFDPKKLEWMNGQHLVLTGAVELEPLITPLLIDAGITTHEELNVRREWYLSLIDLLRVRARTLDDLARQAKPFFGTEVTYDPAAVAAHWKDRAATAELLRTVSERLAALHEWTAKAMEDALRALAEERGMGAGKLFQPLRVALTGSATSPGIFDVLLLLGRERSLARVDAAATAAGAA